MNDILGLFDIEIVKKELYQVLFSSLKDFSKTRDNNNVYAIALDCESEVGTINLCFMNRELFKDSSDYYIRKLNYKDSDIYGIHHLEYNTGDFKSIIYSEDNYKKLLNFMNLYSFIQTGEYYGNEELPKEIKTQNSNTIFKIKQYPTETLPKYAELVITNDNKNELSQVKSIYLTMFLDIVEYCVLTLKENIDFINKTEDFIIFYVDHDISSKKFENFLLKSVDKALLGKLLNKNKT